jgi:predicted nucleic acid-binding protein
MIYWDTSVIVKLYAEEEDSAEWQQRILLQEAPLRTSALSFSEMAYALKQKEARAEIKSGAAKILFKLFESDVDAGRFLLVPIGKDVLKASVELLACGSPLRTLDGLHLATAKLLKCHKIATTDRRLAEAARSAGFKLLFDE